MQYKCDWIYDKRENFFNNWSTEVCFKHAMYMYGHLKPLYTCMNFSYIKFKSKNTSINKYTCMNTNVERK